MNQTRPRVLLDVDGVLGDFVSVWLDTIRRHCALRIEPREVTGWDLFEVLAHRFPDDFTLSRAKDACYTAAKSEGFHDELQPYDGAQDGVARLARVADVYVVTSPWHGPWWCYERDGWLGEHFGIQRSHIVHTNAKHLCAGDVFVDDRPENVSAWHEAHPASAAALWSQPWNQAHAMPPSVVRAASWDVVEQLVLERTARAA